MIYAIHIWRRQIQLWRGFEAFVIVARRQYPPVSQGLSIRIIFLLVS